MNALLLPFACADLGQIDKHLLTTRARVEQFIEDVAARSKAQLQTKRGGLRPVAQWPGVTCRGAKDVECNSSTGKPT